MAIKFFFRVIVANPTKQVPLNYRLHEAATHLKPSIKEVVS